MVVLEKSYLMETLLQFVSVEEHVESLLDKLPTFSETCSNFMKVAQEINTRWMSAGINYSLLFSIQIITNTSFYFSLVVVT